VNATVSLYTSSVNGVSLPTDYPYGRVTVQGCAVRSALTGCQVTSRSHDRFSRYSKWLDTFWTDLIFSSVALCFKFQCLETKKNGSWVVTAKFSTDSFRWMFLVSVCSASSYTSGEFCYDWHFNTLVLF